MVDSSTRMRPPEARGPEPRASSSARQRQTAAGDEPAVSRHNTLDLDEASDATDDPRAGLELRAWCRRRRKLERTKRRETKDDRPGVDRRRGDAAGLREHLDEDDPGNDWFTGKVTLEIEIVWRRHPSACRALARRHIHDRFEQAHRGAMWQSVNPTHEAFQYTVRPVNAIVEHWDRTWPREPKRPLVHVPAGNFTLTAHDIDLARRQYETALASAGIADGHLIVTAIGNHPGLASVLLAAWNVGAVMMPVDIDTPEAELREVVERFAACALLRARRADSMGADDPSDSHHDLQLEGQLRLSIQEGRAWIRYADAALLKLTSGSTGLPKAVRATDWTLVNDTRHIVSAMGIGPDDLQLAAIPLSHAYGFGNLLMPVLLQGTAVVLRESFVPQQVVGDARRYGARVLQGVPFMFQYFVTHPPAGGWPEPLTLLISAGARLEPETVRSFSDRFGVKIHSFYGTSEAGGIAFDASPDVDGLATVGWPIPGVTLELRPDDTIPAGEGRVYVRGDGVAQGYVGDATISSDLEDGGFLTGDYGHLMSDGRLVLAGRVSAFINVAGRKVQPEEVERVLRDMPGVRDVRVLAALDEARGERIAAVIAGDPTLTLTAVRRYCAKRLTAHKIPRAVVLVDDIPVTLRGKTDRRALQALVDAHLARTV